MIASQACLTGASNETNLQLIQRQEGRQRVVPFRIKICGVTRRSDVQMIGESGADAIGLNFYPKSKRFVSEETAEQLCERWPAQVAKVGVFVNASTSQLRAAAQRFSLDWLQLHGDEPAELVAEMAQQFNTIRAFRVGNDGIGPVLEQLDRIAQAGQLPQAILLDAAHATEYGGTGTSLDWDRLAPELSGIPSNISWLLAGGLNPTNVRQAIATTGPTAVDTASGVESAPGLKTQDLVSRFVQAARLGWRDRTSS